MVPAIRLPLIAFVMTAAVASAGAAKIEFGSRIPLGVNHGYRFRVADFNGDGRRDIIINNYYEPVISWLERTVTVDPVYINHDIRLPYTYGGEFDVGDIDHDGDLDIVSSGLISSETGVAWYENRGGANPAIVPHVIAASQPAIRNIVIADVDNDDDPDVVVASMGPVLYWYENSGGSAPTFTARLIYREPMSNDHQYHAVRAADLDGDGDVDLVTACQGLDGGFIWYENTGGNPVSWVRRVLPSGISSGYGLAVCDLDGDGDPDIIGTGSSSAFWLQNGGGANPAFTCRVLSGSGLNVPDCIVTYDLNEDGRPDIMINNPEQTYLYYYLNDGAAIPAFARYTYGSDKYATWVGGEDLDGDGDPDIIQLSANYGIDVSWFRNPSACVEEVPAVAPEAGFSAEVKEGGTTGVGHDFVVGNPSGDKSLNWSASANVPWLRIVPASGTLDPGTTATVRVSFTQGTCLLRSGPYRAAVAFKGNDPTVIATERTVELVVKSLCLTTLIPHPGVATGVDSYTYRMDVCDLNGDGQDDIISASWHDGLTWLRRDLSQPSGFSARKYPLGITNNDRVSPGDLDRDGDLDLVTLGWVSATPKLVWLENDGKADPNLTLHEIDSQTRIRDFTVADMDSDGFPDIVVTTQASSMKWYENNGGVAPLVFTNRPMLDQPDSTQVFNVECADIDGDGDPDAVTYALPCNQLAWVENRLSQSAPFVTRPIAVEGVYACPEFKISDFDGDGDPDVVAVFHDYYNTDGRPGKVAWFENIRAGGSSTFIEHVIDQTIIYPIGFCVADLENDNSPDLFVGTQYQTGSNDVFFIENRNGTTPRFAVNYFRNVYRPRAFVSADFDHNGTIDMIMMPLGQYDFFENPRENSAGDWINYR